MSDRSINLSYSLRPPSQTTPPIEPSSASSIPSTSSQSYPVGSSSRGQETILPPSITPKTSNTARYYESLTFAIREVQTNLNEVLTQWKDAIGDAEKSKEDLGKVGHGKGRATVMSLAVNGDFADQREGYKVKTVPRKAVDSESSDESESE
ncbi:uncharacterized protein I303_107021 [Kwoniella dejecticola CBS 10117]|uniref:Uncharacterized protein n=1 Tax=Kwoniella dejecticola CBS 10117 TaxID=1296121 RepID=A0A1A5ZYI3_9TREE|nr:uncharacterized protein I303_06422 [Kwoniella dejecticola CBS 10117]OBR82865.1 hypothetical protein I303_06422 [Kwoniella dejecticola CBS 10117]